jgi:hypothetical protein
MSRTSDDARRLRRLAAALLAELLIGGAVAAGARLAGPGGEGDGTGASEVARALELSGLAIGSGAAYTRHPAQSDGLAPFGDHPGAIEHLPSGSLIPPSEWPRGWEGIPADGAVEAAP